MTPSDKETLLDQFRAYLDTLEEEEEEEDAWEEETDTPDPPQERAERIVDLYALFVELTALKNEIKIESRQVKTALDHFRNLVEPLQAGYAALQGDRESARREHQEKTRQALQPLLLELLELRDRMVAATAGIQGRKASGLARFFFRDTEELMKLWQEGHAMTVRRLDQILASQGVVPLTLLNRPLDPRVARAVLVEQRAGVRHGIVLAEIRQGFLWHETLLRPAEVLVNHLPTDSDGET